MTSLGTPPHPWGRVGHSEELRGGAGRAGVSRAAGKGGPEAALGHAPGPSLL